MGAGALGPGCLVWALVAALWLFLARAETRGRNWHIALALAPFAGFVLAAFAPPSLAEAARLWLLMGVVIGVTVALAWAIGTALGNHGVMDIFYSLAVLAAAVAALAVNGFDLWRCIWLAPIALWSIRLATQTYGHNIGSEREPYASWRRRQGSRWIWWSFFQVHLLQGVTVWIWCFALALAVAAHPPQAWAPAIAGLAVWLVGFALQSTADRELTAFKRDPAQRGKLLTTGAWSLVRHPNYLGEAIMWQGLFLFALAHPYGLLGVVSPLFATWFMGYASAAPFKERHMARTRPEAWAAYCAATPRFLPWPRPGR